MDINTIIAQIEADICQLKLLTNDEKSKIIVEENIRLNKENAELCEKIEQLNKEIKDLEIQNNETKEHLCELLSNINNEGILVTKYHKNNNNKIKTDEISEELRKKQLTDILKNNSKLLY